MCMDERCHPPPSPTTTKGVKKVRWAYAGFSLSFITDSSACYRAAARLCTPPAPERCASNAALVSLTVLAEATGQCETLGVAAGPLMYGLVRDATGNYLLVLALSAVLGAGAGLL